MEFAYVVGVVETECCANAVDADAFGHLADVFVKGAADIFEVGEDEGLVGIEAGGYDILCIG